nr:hypothetical protein [Tanacetum cinerariifolium]
MASVASWLLVEIVLDGLLMIVTKGWSFVHLMIISKSFFEGDLVDVEAAWFVARTSQQNSIINDMAEDESVKLGSRYMILEQDKDK